jgi:hypothetical protein
MGGSLVRRQRNFPFPGTLLVYSFVANFGNLFVTYVLYTWRRLAGQLCVGLEHEGKGCPQAK